MSKFSAFMAQNVAKIENKKFVLSDRFKDENGKPIEWEIRALTAEESDDINRRCVVNVPVPGHRGQFSREVDGVKLASLFICESVVYPDLNDAALQDSYGVKTPVDLLKKMLYTHEENKLAEEVKSFSNLPDLGELVEEAKN